MISTGPATTSPAQKDPEPAAGSHPPGVWSPGAAAGEGPSSLRPRPGRASLPTCWISSSVSGCWRPSSFMGKLVCGSSTVSRYLPLFELCSWLLAPVTDRTKSLLVVPRHPGWQRRRGDTHKFRAAARAAAPGPRGCSPQRMAGQPRPPGERQVLSGRFPPGLWKTGTPENLHKLCRSAHARGARKGREAGPSQRPQERSHHRSWRQPGRGRADSEGRGKVWRACPGSDLNHRAWLYFFNVF